MRWLGALALLCACNDSSRPPADMGPPTICKTPGAPPSGAWFTEVTDEMLGAAAATTLGTSVRAADLDGDGFPDLISTVATTATRDTDTMRSRWLLMNRPDPADASKRILVDATAESGLLLTRDSVGGRVFGVASLGDLDGNGTIDLVGCPPADGAPDPCTALLNDGTAHFTLAPEAGLEAAGAFQVDGATLLDYDMDGRLDYWPGTYGGQPVLFRGRGDGGFDEVGALLGLPTVDGDPAKFLSFRHTFGVTSCDLDGDGDPDVLLADYGREHNQVWRNDRGKFTEIGDAIGLAADDRLDYSDDQSYLCYCQMTAGACPAGLPKPPMGYCPGRGWVPGQSDQPWRLGGNNFGLACGDVDNDGDLDVMTATIVHWDVGSSSDPSELVLNPGGALAKFTRPGNDATGLTRTRTSPDWNDGDMMPVFADVDLDGLPDIYLTSSDYPGDFGLLWHQKPDHTFENIGMLAGAAQAEPHGVALVDLDGDGDLDLVLGTSTARGVAKTSALRVYRNDIGQASNWLQVRLVGAGPGAANPSAIGARVTITAGGVTQLQEVQGGSAHNSLENDLVLTFGLGAACTVDQLSVRWPDTNNTTQQFTKVQANYRVEIAQGATAVRYLTK